MSSKATKLGIVGVGLAACTAVAFTILTASFILLCRDGGAAAEIVRMLIWPFVLLPWALCLWIPLAGLILTVLGTVLSPSVGTRPVKVVLILGVYIFVLAALLMGFALSRFHG